MNYEDSKYEMMIHHLILTDIVKKYSVDGYGEGNVFTYNGKDGGDFMHIKMKNLFNIAQQLEGDVLEIGFNAGNSALIFLFANPTIKFYAVDIMRHKYVKDCVEYLNLHFNNRVILLEGSSLDVLPLIDRKLGETISLYHIDGWHEPAGIQADLKNCYELANNDAYVVVDDTNNSCIEEEYYKYVNENKIKTREDLVLEIPPYWPHEIGQFIKE